MGSSLLIVFCFVFMQNDLFHTYHSISFLHLNLTAPHPSHQCGGLHFTLKVESAIIIQYTFCQVRKCLLTVALNKIWCTYTALLQSLHSAIFLFWPASPVVSGVALAMCVYEFGERSFRRSTEVRGVFASLLNSNQ